MTADPVHRPRTGPGSGHLTRSMAIARRLDPARRAAVPHPLGGGAGGPRAGLPGRVRGLLRRRPGAGNDWRWSRRLRARLRAAIAEADSRRARLRRHPPLRGAARRAGGAAAPLGLVPAAAVAARARAGCRSAAAGSSTPCSSRASSPPPRTAARPWRRRDEAHRVGPIVFCDDDELLPRADAERELGLEPGKANVLVQLGQGAEVAGDGDAVPAAVSPGARTSRSPRSPRRSRSSATVPEGVVHLRATYPMSRYFAAFDARGRRPPATTRIHELIRFGVPALFVPMRARDRRPGRARPLRGAGGHRAGGRRPGLGPGSRRCSSELLDAERRAAMRRAPRRAAARGRRRRGRPMARRAGDGPSGGPAPAWGRGGGGAWLRPALALGAPGRPVRRPPAAHVAASSGRRSSRRPPRTVVLALGVAEGALERGSRRALARTPDPPGRVLVVTDSLAARPAAAGAGWGSSTCRAAGERSGAARRRRLRGVPAPPAGADPCRAPAPRRALTIGETGKGLLTEIA